MYSKDVLKLMDINSLVISKDRKTIIKRLVELEEYREHLRQEISTGKNSLYKEKCIDDLRLTTDKMKELGSLLNDFEIIKKVYGIMGVF